MRRKPMLNNKPLRNTWRVACSLMIGLAGVAMSHTDAQAAGAPGSMATMSPSVAAGPSDAGGTPAGSPDVMAQSYLLTPLDVLNITVQNHDEMKQSVQVLADGTFDYPLVGTVHAAGKTAQAVSKIITKGISGTYNHPVVSITVVTSHVAKISVLGNIKAPGPIEFRPGMRVLEALGDCGGLSSPPEQAQATLYTGNGLQKQAIDLVGLMTGDVSQNFALNPGDTLLLEPRALDTYTVQVIGAVNRPGPYPITPTGMTVMELLTLAGGQNATAALTQAQVLHDHTATSLNLHGLATDLNDTTGSMKLAAGDTLLVPENKAKFAVLGEIRSPSLYIIPDGEGMTISQAIAQAGGTTDNGDKKQLAILRRGPDKKRVVIPINIEQMAKNDTGSALDTPILPGDVLFVPTRKKGHSFMDELNSIGSLPYYLRILGL